MFSVESFLETLPQMMLQVWMTFGPTKFDENSQAALIQSLSITIVNLLWQLLSNHPNQKTNPKKFQAVLEYRVDAGAHA